VSLTSGGFSLGLNPRLLCWETIFLSTHNFMIFSWSPSVHFKHLLIVCGARDVTKRCHRNNGLFSERISFYPLFFPCECHDAACCWAPNLSFCSVHVGCCFGLFFASVSYSLDTFILVLGKVVLCGGLFRYKIYFLYFGWQLLNPNMHKWLENHGSIPRSIIFRVYRSTAVDATEILDTITVCAMLKPEYRFIVQGFPTEVR
jgi:hypothetical protein